MKVRCAELMFPINIPRFVEKARTRSTDTIALNLEDAVPLAEKATVRTLVKETDVPPENWSSFNVRVTGI